MLSLTDFTEPYWLEDPSLPLGTVRQFIMKDTSFALDDVRKDMAAKRESAVAAMLARLQPDEKEVFGSLIGLAQKVLVLTARNTTCTANSYIHALLRRAYLEIGKRLARAGSLTNPRIL